MKKFTGFSKLGVVFGVLGVLLLGVFAYLVIDGINNATEFEDYDLYSIISPTKDNGWIGDHVKGSENAPVLIFEYADYQCSACASYNPFIDKAVEELDGKLAVVYRNFLLSYHKNAIAAASAAEAAGYQGYWKEYGDKLFSTQSEWFYATGSERTDLFKQYFIEVTGGKGDVEKFSNDIKNPNISRKLDFDAGIGKIIGIGGTPALYIDGQLIDFGNKNGGSVTINGKVISWEKNQSGNELTELLKKIVEAKLSTEESKE